MSFTTGLSALRANQTALSVVGHNIANASTEGYRRQQAIFAEREHLQMGGLSIGSGVTISEIRSAEANVLEEAIVESLSQGASLNSMLSSSRRLESLFLPGTGNIQERTEELFLSLDQLSARPTEATLRSGVVRAADDLAEEINRLTVELDAMSADMEYEIEAVIETINAKAKVIAGLNETIITAENSGQQATDSKNQRDRLVNELAELVDVEKHKTSAGHDRYVIAGGLFSLESGLESMQLIRAENGELQVWREGCDSPHKIEGGKLAALLSQTDPSSDRGGVGAVRRQLDEFTSALVSTLDAAHATGVGIAGGMDSIISGRPIEDTGSSLATQKTISPIEAGSLFVSIKDPEGQTSVERIDINPAAQSLNDIAASISEVEHLSANVDATGRIAIFSVEGYTFGFTGNLATVPDVAGHSGSSQPTISGRVHGTENENWTFRFLGSGTVGVTEGLKLEVVDSNNFTRNVISIGSDYEPSSNLLIDRGVELALTSGSVVEGETFDLQVVGEPDETGILAALGIGTLFVGDSAATLAVNPNVDANPSLLATTTNEDPSDTRNLLRMLAVRDAPTLRGGTVPLEQFLSDLVGGLGSETAELERDIAGHEEHAAFLDRELQSIVGVDVNEELAKMLQYQQSYQAAARYISSIDQMIQELFNIVG